MEKYDPTIEDSYRKVGPLHPHMFLEASIVQLVLVIIHSYDSLLLFLQQVEVDGQQCMLEILDTAGTVRPGSVYILLTMRCA